MDVKRNSVKLKVPYESNENHLGILNASSQFLLCGVPGVVIPHLLFNMEDTDPVIVELDVKYIKPVMCDLYNEQVFDDELITQIEADMLKKGKSRFELKGLLKDAKGEVLTKTHGWF